MTDPPADRCGYLWPEGFDPDDAPDTNHQNCCWRETWRDHDRCVWHVETDERKPPTALETVRETEGSRERNRGPGTPAELLDGASLDGADLTDVGSFAACTLRDAALTDADLGNAILSGADFGGADLSRAGCYGADLGGAGLRGADLRDAYLPRAVLTRADLTGADLSRANVWHADLERADLTGADLPDAYLRDADLGRADLTGATLPDANLAVADLGDAALYGADLGGADLHGTDLSGADVREVDLSGIRVNQATRCGRQERGEREASNPEDWDALARAYHDLETAFTDHGLVAKARDHYVLERRARGREVRAADGWLASGYLGSLASRFTTGYGVRVSQVAVNMVLLFSVSTAWYLVAGVEGSVPSTLSYSVITFTTAPPAIPEGVATQVVAMIETFFGTLLIVLLGYVLSNRERF